LFGVETDPKWDAAGEGSVGGFFLERPGLLLFDDEIDPERVADGEGLE
jgi:hypothetical protein